MGFHNKASTAPVLRAGTSNFGGYGSYTTVTLSPAMPDTDYVVVITPNEDAGYVGEFYINNKTTNAFRVTNSGSGVSGFDWQAEAY